MASKTLDYMYPPFACNHMSAAKDQEICIMTLQVQKKQQHHSDVLIIAVLNLVYAREQLSR